jgi:hypothetical protein
VVRFLRTESVQSDLPNCEIDGGEHVQVGVADASGKIVGVTTLNKALPTPGDCIVNFTVSGLPRETFYTITINRVDEGTYSFKDLDQVHWHLDLVSGQ